MATTGAPPWEIVPTIYTACPESWHCTVRTGPSRRPCRSWGMARTRAEAETRAAAHATTHQEPTMPTTDTPALSLPAIAVACPDCGAAPGFTCTSHGGTRPRRNDVHQARTRAHQEQPEPDDGPTDGCPQCGQPCEYVPCHDDGTRMGPAWLCTGCKWGQWSAGA